MPGIGSTAEPKVAEVVKPFLMGIAIGTLGAMKIINAIKIDFKEHFLFMENPNRNNGLLY